MNARSKAIGSAFLTALSQEAEALLANTSEIVIATATTAPTRWCPPQRVSATTRIGNEPWTVYRGKHPSARAASQPRLRALSLLLNGVSVLCLDWDMLPAADKQRLLVSLFDEGKLIIGHDLATTFAWLFGETNARPSLIFDLLYAIQQLRPHALYRPSRWAAEAGPNTDAARKWLIHTKGKPEFSLGYAAFCEGIDLTQDGFEKHESWSVSVLSDRHADALTQRVHAVRSIVLKLAGSSELLTRQSKGVASTWNEVWSSMTIRIAEAHVRGVPFDTGAANHQRNTHSKTSIAAARTKQKDTNLRGLVRSAGENNRLHPLLTLKTSTLRTSCRYPALQGLPGTDAWRGLIRARQGHTFISLDYASMELRIAAALAARAAETLGMSLRSRTREDWWLGIVAAGESSDGMATLPCSGAVSPANWNRAATLYASQEVLGRGIQNMRSILQRGLDPHLVTALEFARRHGSLTFSGSASHWLQSRSAAEQSVLKEELAAERRAGKACNFGLLYGMGASGLHRYGQENYDLSWTEAEASEARTTWLATYPELLLWRLWTRYAQSRFANGPAVRWDVAGRELVPEAYPFRVFETRTLTERPAFSIAITKALAAQGQGTGADILALAIARLPQWLSDLFVLPVHDELLFEVPTSLAGEAMSTAQAVMRQAGHEILGFDIPIIVETSQDETWS